MFNIVWFTTNFYSIVVSQMFGIVIQNKESCIVYIFFLLKCRCFCFKTRVRHFTVCLFAGWVQVFAIPFNVLLAACAILILFLVIYLFNCTKLKFPVVIFIFTLIHLFHTY